MKYCYLLICIFFSTNTFAQSGEKYLKLNEIVIKDTIVSCSFSNGTSSCGNGNLVYTYVVPPGKIAKLVNMFAISQGTPYVYVNVNDKPLLVDRPGSECGNCLPLTNDRIFEPIWLKGGETLRVSYYAYNGGGTMTFRLSVHEYLFEN
jgi:hypothetical protein